MSIWHSFREWFIQKKWNFIADLLCSNTSIMSGIVPLQWRHNGRDGVSNHQPHDCLLNRLFRRKSKKTSKLRVTGLCVGNSPVNSPHKWPVTRKIFHVDDVIMLTVFLSIFSEGVDRGAPLGPIDVRGKGGGIQHPSTSLVPSYQHLWRGT